MSSRKKRGRSLSSRYVALYHYVLNSPAWKSLDVYERAIYVHILSKYGGPGSNNGRLIYSCRMAADEHGISKDKAAKSLERLVDRGFVLPTRKGGFNGVTIRFPDRRTDHEVELGVVISRKTGPVAEADALCVVAGYAIALDMSVRGPEDRSFRKSPDSYAVLGPWLVTADEVGDPGALDFSLRVNGELRQAANTREMIIGVASQIAWASSMYTLYPGDIIMTGTCQGVAPVKPGS